MVMKSKVNNCPVCGNVAHKNEKLAQCVYSCSSCNSNFFVVITTGGELPMPNADTTDRGGEISLKVTQENILNEWVRYKFGGSFNHHFLNEYDSETVKDIVTSAMTQYANAEVRKVLEELEKWTVEWEELADYPMSGSYTRVIEHIQSLLKSIK